MTQEQSVIRDHFMNFNNGRGGKFVEVGVEEDPQLSNVRTLYEQGWVGIVVDGSTSRMAKVRQVYGSDPRFQLLNYAINDADGMTQFTEKIMEGNVEKEITVQVQAMSVNRFMSLHGYDIDFINLNSDRNMLIFLNIQNDFWHRLKAISIKHYGYHEQIKQRLMSFGFRVLLLNDVHLIMGK